MESGISHRVFPLSNKIYNSAFIPRRAAPEAFNWRFQMDLRICEYCGMEYSAEESVCPICGRAASPEAVVIPAPKAAAGKKGGARLKKGGRFAAKKGGRITPPQEAPEDGGNVYAIPKWMMVVICVVLALAVIAGALYALYAIGYFTGFASLTTGSAAPAAQAQTDTSVPAAPETADEQKYINEEDYLPAVQDAEEADRSVPCTGIALGTTSITFQEAEQFFNITVETQPSGCTEPVSFASADETVATVNQQGKIMATGGGSTEITVTCGSYSASCLVTCDFAVADPQEAVDQTLPALSSTDMTFTYPNQQATLLVTNVPDEAEILFSSADESIATISSSGVITAVGSGTTTVTAQVMGQSLECIVRCTLGSSTENNGETTYTLSNYDVTMSIKGEYFRLSLKDADGKKVSGLVWTSGDESICTVDENGVVTAVAKGTTTVSTVYEDTTYECIVRCAIKN